MSQATDQGGFLDIALDFVLRQHSGLHGGRSTPGNVSGFAAVLGRVHCTATSFWPFVAIAAKRGLNSLDYPDKSFYSLWTDRKPLKSLAFFAAIMFSL
jgi:hypothetical protein